MNNWTEEEIKIVLNNIERGCTYNQISSILSNNGYYRSKKSIERMIYRRKYSYQEEVNKVTLPITTNGPKILIFDIETLPIVAYTWGLWKQNIGHTQIIQDWCALSWSAKWVNDSTVYHDILTPEEVYNREDGRIVQGIRELLDECDICVAHNGDDFDIKKLNSRFILNGVIPPSPYQTIDTLKQVRKIFGFTSNKLDYLAELLENDRKIKTDFELWALCDNGDPEALKTMLSYNDYDVTLLEEIYFQLLPWMRGIPNFALYTELEEPVCGHCGSSELVENGFYVTPANKYKSYRCNNCGCFIRDRVSSLTKEQRANLKPNLNR